MHLALPRVPQSWRQDIIAGLTVALVAIPQSMAYATVAGAGPINGLYTSIIPTIVGSLFGSSSFLVTGPTNATALVTANVLAAQAEHSTYLEYIFVLAIMAGLIKLLLGVLRLGWIIRYVSNSVLTGFLGGAAILIALSQVTHILGLPKAPGVDAITVVSHTLRAIHQTNPHVLATSLVTMVFIILLKRINKRIPAEILSIAMVGLLVRILGWQSKGVIVISDLGGLMSVSLCPYVPELPLTEWWSLLPSAGAVAIFSLVEAMSIARAISMTSGERLNPSREFVGQGLAAIAGGFFQSIPPSGSLTRTAINYASGGRSRLAAAVSGIVVLLTLVAFGPLLSYIPVASLAGVVVLSAYNLIDTRHLRLTWQSQWESRLVLSVTFVSTLMLPLHIAIYLGALLSLMLYVYESSKIRLSYLTRDPSGRFIEHELEDLLRNPPAIAIVNVEGTLSFGAADDLEQRVDEIIHSGVRVVILRLRRVRMLSSTGITALGHIIAHANRSGTRVLISGVRNEVAETLESSGIKTLLGEMMVFKASDVLFDSTQQALAYAEDIVMSERTHGD